MLTWEPFRRALRVHEAAVLALQGLKGTKLRVLPTPAFMDTFKAMGAVPTPIPFGELYMAVQTGVVDEPSTIRPRCSRASSTKW